MRTIITLLAIAISTSLYSQVELTKKAETTWGAEDRAGKHEEVKKVFSHGDDTFILKKDKRNLLLKKFNKSLKSGGEVKLSYKINRTKYEYVRSIQVQDKLHVVYRFSPRRTNLTNLEYFTVDLGTMKSDFNMQELTSLNYDDEAGMSFDAIVSDDSERILMIIDAHVYHGGPLIFNLQMRDKNMNLVWEKNDVEFKDHQEAHFYLKDFHINENGDSFLLCKEYPNGNSDNGSNTMVDLNFSLMKIGADGEDLLMESIEFPKTDITAAKFDFLNDGNLVVGGLYSKPNSDKVEGAFLQYIDQNTLELLSETEKAIDESMLESKEYGEMYENNDFNEFLMRDIIVDKDNNVKFVAEQEEFVLVVTRTSNGQGASTTTYTYHYYFSNILVVSGTPDGRIDWVTAVKKDQHTIDDSGNHGSFLATVKEDGTVHLMYRIVNEEEDNAVKSLFGATPYLTTFVTVEPDGSVEEEVLVDHKIHDFQFMPEFSTSMNGNKLIVLSDKKRKEQLVGIGFK